MQPPHHTIISISPSGSFSRGRSSVNLPLDHHTFFYDSVLSHNHFHANQPSACARPPLRPQLQQQHAPGPPSPILARSLPTEANRRRRCTSVIKTFQTTSMAIRDGSALIDRSFC
ncbi:hypothetical protein BO94DRAFT_300014 [Aspergillus sclerotioniger CBS 115572]|uniref:Uncharacterized protein n=1 Tax=Aspergillus sclerotioniger CBS 115572 TaxID=1450535 RepID=A0A317V7J2_9EURO|nr:hypothetical protein BO94DRAFT_300014 [Aspergillus sclerotioniger CBS 115572]PWY69018.1 hypothetical protein BO94DRAFT_300014 [Aspergillus sclerotioniger CBS 115572]